MLHGADRSVAFDGFIGELASGVPEVLIESPVVDFRFDTQVAWTTMKPSDRLETIAFSAS
jgi:hypothetical protein